MPSHVLNIKLEEGGWEPEGGGNMAECTSWVCYNYEILWPSSTGIFEAGLYSPLLHSPIWEYVYQVWDTQKVQKFVCRLEASKWDSSYMGLLSTSPI